jgi:multiple sugar transport system permease protein
VIIVHQTGLLNKLQLALPFVVGALLVFALVVIYPLLYSFWVSLHQWIFIRSDRPFIGIENYSAVLSDPFFMQSIWRTVVFVVGTTLLSVVGGLGLAVMLSGYIRGKVVIRTLLLIPFVMTPVITALVWKTFFFDAQFGLINAFLNLLGFSDVQWLTNGWTAMFAVVFVDAWNYTPMIMLVLGAAIATLPKEPFEAAKIDGASSWQQFTHLTLPMIQGPLIFAVLFRITQSFKVFEIIYVMTGGGPGYDTRVLSLYIYDTALRNLNMGQANAQSYVMMAVIVLICAVTLKIGSKGTGRVSLEK